MTQSVKNYIEYNIGLIDNNDFDRFYEEAQFTLANNREIAELTEILVAAGLDPLKHLDYIPEAYLYNNQDIIKFEIPPHIKRIESKAFCFCGHLKEIRIPSSVSYIDYNAFCGCTALDTVYFEPLAIDIENEAFDQCYHIKEVCFSGTIEEWQMIMDECFCSELENCPLISCTDGDIHND